MKYIMAHINRGLAEIDGITENPRAEVLEYEPIDVIDGNIVIWDDQANLYHFTSQNPAGGASINGVGTTVEVGTWGGDDPQIKLISQDDSEGLRTAILDYLQDKTYVKKHWWSKRRLVSSDVSDYESLPLSKLMDLVKPLE